MPPRLAPRRAPPLIRLCLAALLGCAPAAAGESGAPDTPEQAYAAAMRQSIGAPARAELGEQAFLRLSGDLVLVPHDAAARLLAVSQMRVPDRFLALLLGPDGMDAPGAVRFVPAGFVDADAALAWTAEDILDSLRDTVERANAGRAARNLPEQEVRRWVRPPAYNPETHTLSWAALIVPKTAPGDADGEITLQALAFGRAGYVEMSMPTSSERADSAGRTADRFLEGVNFLPGKAYPDAEPGDPRAPGGLAAAMGIDALHKAGTHGGFWGADPVLPLAGGIVASVGAASLFLYIQRHLRRQARRG